ncbi:MAG: carboxypeptidase regulatory-like domain-containing protein [Acidimicrobiales bacterium]
MSIPRHRLAHLLAVVAVVAVGMASLAPVGGVAPAAAQTAPGATFTPGVDVPLDFINGMDDLGRLVGTRAGSGAVYDPSTGSVTEIGSLGGYSSAEAITEGGLVAGSSQMSPSSSDEHAVVFDLGTGTLTDLGTVGFNAHATDVTDAGLVVGWGYALPSVTRGFVYDLASRTMTTLADDSMALAVNDHGLVLGRDPRGTFVLDAHTGARTDLGARIPGLEEATTLSDSGLVAGTANDANGRVVFVHDLASGQTWRVGGGAIVDGYPHVERVTDGGAVFGTVNGLDWYIGFVAVPESGVIENVPPMPNDSTTEVNEANNRGELAGRSCYWENFTPALHCDEPFRTTVRLAPTPPRVLAVSSCVAPAALTWQSPRFDGFAPITGYEVHRNGVTIASLPPTARTFTDPGATAGSSYEVLARNAQGISPPSAAAAWPGWPCRGGAVRGVVTATGAPQPGIAVRLVDAADGHLVRKAVTDATGAYAFPSLEPGRYALRFDDPSLRLLLEWYDDAPSRASATVLDVAVGAGIVANADLTPAAGIEGAVVGSGSIGLPGINVRVYDGSTGTLVAKTVTRSDGGFTIGSLSPRQVKIRFDDPTGLHQVQWFGGGSTFDQAPSSTLVAGDVLRVDHLLSDAGILVGTVLDDAGRPIVGMPVRAYDPSTHVALAKGYTDASGRYRIAYLRPGSWLVRFGDQIAFPLEWYHDQPTVAAADPVTIVAGATTTADETVAMTP